MRKINFVNDNWYHICNRGVEKRDIFVDYGDYERFVCHLYELNDIKPCLDLSFDRRKNLILQNVGNLVSDNDERNKLVDVAIWFLMPNHFHLLVRQLKDNGVSMFLQKLGVAYTKGFNKKYDRVGPLFQGTFQAKEIDSDEYFRYLFAYIFSNVKDLINYRTGSDKNNAQKIKEFLESYEWSSYPNLIGKTNFPAITNNNFTKEMFDENDFEKFMADLLVSET